jgi:cyclase
MQRLKDNIYIETGFIGCNPGFVSTSEGVVMIDTPQKPSEAFEWRKEIQKHGQVRYIINTDHHRDHALGNTYFDGDIVMHEGTMEKLHGTDNPDQNKHDRDLNDQCK